MELLQILQVLLISSSRRIMVSLRIVVGSQIIQILCICCIVRGLCIQIILICLRVGIILSLIGIVLCQLRFIDLLCLLISFHC